MTSARAWPTVRAIGSAKDAAAGARYGRGGMVAVPSSCGAAAGWLEPTRAVSASVVRAMLD